MFVRKVFDGWGHYDPAGAAAAAMNLPKATRGTALHASLYQWGRVDPVAALAWLDLTADPEVKSGNRQTVLRVWADTDPHAAASYALTLEGKQRQEGLGLVIRSLAGSDAAAAERLLEEIPAGRVRHEQTRSMIDAIGQENPQFAARLMLGLPARDQEQSAYQVGRYLARHDRTAALAWATQLPRPRTRDQAMRAIIGEWAEQDPKGAVEYCVGTNPGNTELLRNAIGVWTSAAPEAAIAWVRALPDATHREQLLASAATSVGYKDHEAAFRIAETLTPGSDAQRNAIANIASSLARKDASAALASISQLPERTADAAVTRVLQATAQEDPAATATWLDKLPAGGRRDKAILTFTSQIVADDPTGAVAWAATISDPERRANCLGDLFSNWSRDDKPAAVEWLRQTPFMSEEQRQRYLAQAQRNQH